MADSAVEQSISSLVEKLAALELKIADQERKIVELESKNVGPAPENAGAAEADSKTKTQETSPSEGEKTDKDKKDESLGSRFKVVVHKADPETGERIEEDSKVPDSKEKADDRDKYAFVMHKNVYDKVSLQDFENESEIEIISLDLWNLLKQHLGHFPNHLFRGPPVLLYSPYEQIVFQYDDLRNEAGKDSGDDEQLRQARSDLGRLLDIISGGSSGDERLDKYFKIRDSYKQPSTANIQFEDLWTFFPPGTLIYGRPFQNEHQVFVVKDNHRPWPSRSNRGGGARELAPWKLDAWSYDWVEGTFQRTLFTLTIDFFDGQLPLTSLDFYPFELHKEYDVVRKQLIKRGRRFYEICSADQASRLFEYEGNTILEKKGFSGLRPDEEDGAAEHDSSDYLSGFTSLFRSSRRRPIESSDLNKPTKTRSRVMVDYESYFQYGRTTSRNGYLEAERTDPGCACSDCLDNEELRAKYRTHFDSPSRTKAWEDEQYLICPPRVLGYILEEKQWAQLQVSSLHDLTKFDSDDAWRSRLKLADEFKDTSRKRAGYSTKDFLLDLVHSHTSTTMTNRDPNQEDALEVDDIIPGKGKGLVILLYGPPGVGKTSTAETIATATQKPLFSVSVADVGTKAKNVESNLARIFALATKWQAILLIDEADVFLETRGRGGAVRSTDKNALVSVFLRVLEYYQGIMFLTTNQIAEFDIAIPSRIHVAIKYESLREPQMEAIFLGFLDKLDRRDLIENYDEIKEWLAEYVYKVGFDGRQIRNIVTTALGVARAEAKRNGRVGKLRTEHLKRAFENSSSFKSDFDKQMQRYIDSQEKMIK